MTNPKVILLDAVGTLFGVRGSVGQIYSAIARQFNVNVPPKLVNDAFFQAFAAADPLVFPDTDPEEIHECEFEWWRVIALRTFQKVGVLEQFTDFTDFFDHLYNHFATTEPWFIYPDVIPSLEAWRRVDIQLGVLSNFDSRLYFVLKALNLDEFFSSITISTEAGAAKPDPKIFTHALQKYECEPSEAWHIGDSLREDYQGAKAAGLRAIWLERSENMAEI